METVRKVLRRAEAAVKALSQMLPHQALGAIERVGMDLKNTPEMVQKANPVHQGALR